MYICTHVHVESMLICGHVVYRAQDVVQCTSIVGAVASAAVSSDGIVHSH